MPDTILSPTYDATIVVTSPTQNLDASEGQVGTQNGYRLLLGYTRVGGNITAAKLRFQIIQATPDGAVPTLLCVIPLTAGIPIVEGDVNAISPNGTSYEWPDGYHVTDGVNYENPGMSGFVTPLITFPWPEYPDPTFGIEIDVTTLVQNYPVPSPSEWAFMLYSSDETNSKADIFTGQKDFEDQLPVQLVITRAAVGGRSRGRHRGRGWWD